MRHDPRPATSITVVTSATRTTSSNSGNVKDLTTDFPSMAQELAIVFNLSNYVIGPRATTGQVRFFVDTSPDGGTIWLPAWQSYDASTSTAVRTARFVNGMAVNNVDENFVGSTSTTTIAKGPASTTTSQLAVLYPLTRDKRVRWEVGNDASAGNAPEATFAVYAIARP